MKLIKVFAVFIALHVFGWLGAHLYMSQNARTVLVVADTSFAMKDKFSQMQDWIEDYESSSRYRNIVVGSDKALLGNLTEVRSISQVFRANYGRIKADSLQKYESIDATEKFLLSDGSVTPAGWTLVQF